MGRLDREKIKTVWDRLEKAKIFNVGELASLLTCSVPNARLKLKQWQAYTSYNQNGKYYTLPQVPLKKKRRISGPETAERFYLQVDRICTGKGAIP